MSEKEKKEEAIYIIISIDVCFVSDMFNKNKKNLPETDELRPNGVLLIESDAVRRSGQTFSGDSNGRFVPCPDNEGDDYGGALELHVFPEKSWIILSLGLGFR